MGFVLAVIAGIVATVVGGLILEHINSQSKNQTTVKSESAGRKGAAETESPSESKIEAFGRSLCAPHKLITYTVNHKDDTVTYDCEHVSLKSPAGKISN